MFEEFNNMLNRFSSLRQEIQEIKTPPNDLVKSKNKAEANFSKVLSQKKNEGQVDSAIKRLSSSEGVDEELVRAVIDVESGFDPGAVSDKGARGLMQLMPDTAAQLGVNPDNPVENVDGGVRYLGRMMDRFGSLEEALAAYNAGPEAVESHGGVPPYRETENYVKQVLDKYRKLKQDGEK